MRYRKTCTLHPSCPQLFQRLCAFWVRKLEHVGKQQSAAWFCVVLRGSAQSEASVFPDLLLLRVPNLISSEE